MVVVDKWHAHSGYGMRGRMHGYPLVLVLHFLSNIQLLLALIFLILRSQAHFLFIFLYCFPIHGLPFRVVSTLRFLTIRTVFIRCASYCNHL